MLPILQILNLTLQTIAASVFNITFLMVLFIIYTLYKKNMDIEKHSLSFAKTSMKTRMVEATLQGIVMGIIGSLVLVGIGLPISLSPFLFLLLPIAMVLALLNLRYLCFSYAAAVLGGIGILIPALNLDISGLIALVGIMHLMEAGLIFISGASESIPVVVRKKEKIAVGFLMQKYWPIPFALLVIQVMMNAYDGGVQMPGWWPMLKQSISKENIPMYSLLPITAALGYGNIAVTTSPEKKAQRSALELMGYSAFLLFIALISVHYFWLQVIGLILMPLIHEWIILRDHKKESMAEPIYTLPQKGVRVIEPVPEGPGEKMGLRRGDIITKVNGLEILNEQHLKAVLNNYYTFLWIDVVREDGTEKTLEYRAYPGGINDLKIIHLPENPRITYRLESMKNVGMLQMIKKRIQKK